MRASATPIFPHTGSAFRDDDRQPGNLETMFREIGAPAQPTPERLGAICATHRVRFV